MFQEIKSSLQQLYREDGRPWLVGFSGGKDSAVCRDRRADTIARSDNIQSGPQVTLKLPPPFPDMIRATASKV
jgi:3'-phosphoadenosine 5'-phosphosulfate sulfotransferase (PAPS reductase)/FAD synthetase